MVVPGRTKDDLKAYPRRAPASAAPFSDLVSESEAMPWAEIDPTEVLRRKRDRWCFGMVRNCELRKVSSAKVGGAWGKREGG